VYHLAITMLQHDPNNPVDDHQPALDSYTPFMAGTKLGSLPDASDAFSRKVRWYHLGL